MTREVNRALMIARATGGRAQEITSADTSIKQVPALFKSPVFEKRPGQRNLDIGGGKYDLGTEHLANEHGVESHVYDPFNRPPEHNDAVLKKFARKKADSVTAANVLNVIQHPHHRKAVIKQAHDHLHDNGAAYFGIYEGNGTGAGGITSKGWQNNRKAAGYMDEVRSVFPHVERKGNIIVARKRAYGGRADEKNDLWWHGSGSGDLRGGESGLHLGTQAAAEDALNARIGFPAEGAWDGSREYGKTKLAGKNTILKRNPYGLSGHNIDAPDEDYFPHEHPRGLPMVSRGFVMKPEWRPSIRPYKLTGPMTNTPQQPHDDWKANGYMRRALNKGNAKRGYFYRNEGEDSGSISAVVPSGAHVEPVERANGGKIPPFKLHSGAADLIEKKGQPKATPQQYAAMPGIKPDEIKHSGFAALGTKAIPREQAAQHLREHMVPVQETVLGERDKDDYIAKNRDWLEDSFRSLHGRLPRSYDELAYEVDAGTDAEHSEQQLPGGKNYREVLLHLPDPHAAAIKQHEEKYRALSRRAADAMENWKRISEERGPGHPDILEAYKHVDATRKERTTIADKLAELRKQQKDTLYRHPHWDVPNVLAHIRMSDRKGPNGEKVLHVEELQSDWGQEGRQQGFKNPLTPAERDELKRFTDPPDEDTARRNFEPANQARWEELERRANSSDHGLPSGPYVDNTQKWTDLALKRVLHEAAHGGYDKVVFTPGAEQNKRYKLSNQVRSLHYYPFDDGTGNLQFIDHRGTRHSQNDIKTEELPKYVGKEVAEKLLATKRTRRDRAPSNEMLGHHLENLKDVEVGGEGMRGYYDNIMPKRLQALAQQHDPQAKVRLKGERIKTHGEWPFPIEVSSDGTNYWLSGRSPHNEEPKGRLSENFPSYIAADDAREKMYSGYNQPVHALDVTSQMRDSIKANGFNQFKAGGYVRGTQDMNVIDHALRICRAAGGGAGLQNLRQTDTGGTSVNELANAFQKAIDYHTSLPPDQRIANSKAAMAKIGQHTGFYKGTNKPFSLLGKNQKLEKTEIGYEGSKPVTLPDGRPIAAAGVSLSPAVQFGKFNTCPNHASCKESCLGKTSGGNFLYGGGHDLEAYKGPRLVGLNKTKALVNEPEAFATRLYDEIDARKRLAAKEGKHLGVRLNVISDLHPRITQSLIKAHPDVTFYDYTKLNANPVAPNHHLTYSSTGVSQYAGQNGLDHDVPNPHSNWRTVRSRLDTGSNVAMAFTHGKHLPETVHDSESGKTYKVVDGDTHDFRPLDAQPKGEDGVIIGLRNKNMTTKSEAAYKSAAKNSKGFMVHYDPQLRTLEKGQKPVPTNKSVVIAPQPRRAAGLVGHNGGPPLE